MIISVAQTAARISLAAVMKAKDKIVSVENVKKGARTIYSCVVNVKNRWEGNPFKAVKDVGGVIAGTAGADFAINKSIAYRQKQREKNKHEKEFLSAQQRVINLIKQNVEGELGRYGLPKACDQAVLDLVFLPGGREVLQEIQETFRTFFVVSKKRSIASRLLFWRRAANASSAKVNIFI
jgi:hypothetical protein